MRSNVEGLHSTLIFFYKMFGIIFIGCCFSIFWKFFKANSVNKIEESLIFMLSILPFSLSRICDLMIVISSWEFDFIIRMYYRGYFINYVSRGSILPNYFEKSLRISMYTLKYFSFA